jgi:hypothetical protein
MTKIRIPKIILKHLLVCDKCIFYTFDKVIFEKHNHKIHVCSNECTKNGEHKCDKCDHLSKDRKSVLQHILKSTLEHSSLSL